jgi:hypothetical protein
MTLDLDLIRDQEPGVNHFTYFSEVIETLAAAFRVTTEAIEDALVKFLVALPLEDILRAAAVARCGVTEADIRKVDVDNWTVHLWNWRRIEVPHE